MGSLNPPPELTLDLKPTFIPKTITQLLEELSRIGNISEKILKVDDLITRLETEMRKIDAFKRELPLCMLLINNAIAALKDESMAFKKSSNTHPVLEEFIPISKTCNEDAEVEKMVKENGGNDKKNWLSSTQLWNSNDVDPKTYQIQNQKPYSKDQTTKKRTVEEDDVITVNDSSQQFRNINRSFIPLKGCYGFTMMGSIRDDIHITSEFKNSIRRNNLITKSSHDDQSNLPTGGSRGSPHQQQTSRKQRRCWSTELHRQFVNALQQLGGSQVATPKQIRELMQVDGLTNDEVKSHLQKYRLHTRRIPSSNTAYVESSKRLICQSGSPDGPLLIGSTTGGTSTTGGDSMDDEEESKSENYCWKGV